jgi:membrane protease YdiL (CAAX protease family)
LSQWGVVHLIPVFGAAIVLALLYVWKHDLIANMIAHSSWTA